MVDFACKKFKIEQIIKCSLGLTKADMRIIDHLMRQKEFTDASEIKKELNVNLSTAQRTLKKLYMKGMVVRKQENLTKGGYVFKYRLSRRKNIGEEIMRIINDWTNNVATEIKRWAR